MTKEEKTEGGLWRSHLHLSPLRGGYSVGHAHIVRAEPSGRPKGKQTRREKRLSGETTLLAGKKGTQDIRRKADARLNPWEKKACGKKMKEIKGGVHLIVDSVGSGPIGLLLSGFVAGGERSPSGKRGTPATKWARNLKGEKRNPFGDSEVASGSVTG